MKTTTAAEAETKTVAATSTSKTVRTTATNKITEDKSKKVKEAFALTCKSEDTLRHPGSTKGRREGPSRGQQYNRGRELWA